MHLRATRPARTSIGWMTRLVALVVVAAAATGLGGASLREDPPARAGRPAVAASPGTGAPTTAAPTTAAPTTAAPTTAAPTTAAPTTTAPHTTATTPVSSGVPPATDLTQTGVEPTATSPVFGAEMRLLWAAITMDRPGLADRAFFPEPAYVQLKALSDDAADYSERLVAHFRLDIGAAHVWLGPAAQHATLLSVLAPPSEAAWVPPGTCFNRVGYWHLPGARLVYREQGEERSIGIASLISWRGVWYVVHLGAVLPPAEAGAVDDPEAGPGVAGPFGGC